MAKKTKDFTKSLGSKNLSSLIPTEEQGTSKKSTSTRTASSSSKKATKDIDEGKPITQVTTFRIDVEKMEAIKAIAFWDRKKIQDVLDEALGQYIGKVSSSTLSKALEEYKKRQ